MAHRFKLGLEDMEPGNWVVWVFELPGCYSRGLTRDEALEKTPSAINELLDNLARAYSSVVNFSPDFDIAISEEFRAIPHSPDYLINAFFKNDKIPPTIPDILYTKTVMELNRKKLLSIVSDLPGKILDQNIDGEVQKNIRGILKHIGTAEWWYWDRLGLAFPRDQRPENIFELLNKIRRFTFDNLFNLVGDERVTTCLGERWSARKLIRRAIWHEHVHTRQIARYLESM